MLRTALSCVFAAGYASLAYAANPPGEAAGGFVLHSTLASVAGERSGVAAPAATVRPGDTLTITGACVRRVKSADNLRVVLTIAGNGAAKDGYHLLATDQEIGANGLQVRVPDVPETANRVFAVKVFRLRDDEPEICDAGTIRIGSAQQHKFG